MVVALLETAILIDLLRNHPPALLWRQGNWHLQCGISAYVWLEVINGAPNKQAQQQAERFMRQFVLAWPESADVAWAMQRLAGFRLSHNVGILDCLIASANARLAIPFYTRNLKHFSPLLGQLAQPPY